jgi:hypothetical protein
MSRMPPGPSFSWYGTSAAGMCSVTRSRMRCTLSTKFSRAALVQIFGWTALT